MEKPLLEQELPKKTKQTKQNKIKTLSFYKCKENIDKIHSNQLLKNSWKGQKLVKVKEAFIQEK